MRPVTFHTARCATLLSCIVAAAAVPAAAAGWLDLRDAHAVRGDAAAGKAGAVVCSACHGVAGVSAVPAFPSLAGQPAEYLYGRLVLFKREARPDSPMTAQVAPLADADMRNLAAWFASLAPAPAPAPATGKTPDAHGVALYREGDPARGVPPCQGCHGSDASGHPLAGTDVRYRIYPRLRGQHAAYLVQRLTDFQAGRRTGSSSEWIMTGVAHGLDPEAMAALASALEAGPD
jgi:cytochrome c553